MPRISIGILGFNEEYGIGQLLQSFQEQTIFQDQNIVEIIVVSNGSTDKTAAVAREKLAALAETVRLKFQVIELPIADKCAAWNHFVHQVSCEADYYILLDADVVLVNPNGLAELVGILEKHPECRICGGKIINQRGELLPEIINGKCYATRGEILRDVIIPEGIISDDAYVAVTIATNWYETDFDEGLRRGFVRQLENITISCGHTPRDNSFTSYNIAGRKRTIMLAYTQAQIDYCMRTLFGGGATAREVAVKLSRKNPKWFLKFLEQSPFQWPPLEPPSLRAWYSPKTIVRYLLYWYAYLLAVKGIRDREFGHLAWKLKGRFW
ncbi:MAG TPA: glycosyltransferase [Synechococcales cyanobacterium M55_K2018_004]|nr:glycosyltransferase [Synechococcales cyanobacterium M55_K2018_004]